VKVVASDPTLDVSCLKPQIRTSLPFSRNWYRDVILFLSWSSAGAISIIILFCKIPKESEWGMKRKCRLRHLYIPAGHPQFWIRGCPHGWRQQLSTNNYDYRSLSVGIQAASRQVIAVSPLMTSWDEVDVTREQVRERHRLQLSVTHCSRRAREWHAVKLIWGQRATLAHSREVFSVDPGDAFLSSMWKMTTNDDTLVNSPYMLRRERQYILH